MRIDVLNWFRTTFVRNVDLAILLFFVATVIASALLNSSPNWFSYLMFAIFAIMLIGQVFLITDFSRAYFFYFFSFFTAIGISVLFWMATNVPYSDYAYPFYAIIVGVLIGIPLIVHLKTRERFGTIHLVPVYSIFFFGLIIVLSYAGVGSNDVTNNSLKNYFLIAIAIFIITSIFGLNIAYRALKLDKALKINNRRNYVIKIKDKLNAKYVDKDAQADIDLLTYYLSSSLDAFVIGDFDRSYIDAFKIIDNHGKAFNRIYTLPIDENEWVKLKGIRDKLSHAKIRGDDNTVERVRALEDLKKGLFEETLNILRIVRFKFIDKVLEEKHAK
jgi:hypothetical protein